VGVTRTRRFFRAGSETLFPSSVTSSARERRTYNQKREPVIRCTVPPSTVACSSTFPLDEPRRTSTYVPRPTPRSFSSGGVAAGFGCVVGTMPVDGELLPPNFHAAITSAVTVAIPASATSTTFRSSPRSWWTRARR
jgi:hypothetical protein